MKYTAHYNTSRVSLHKSLVKINNVPLDLNCQIMCGVHFSAFLTSKKSTEYQPIHHKFYPKIFDILLHICSYTFISWDSACFKKHVSISEL